MLSSKENLFEKMKLHECDEAQRCLLETFDVMRLCRPDVPSLDHLFFSSNQPPVSLQPAPLALRTTMNRRTCTLLHNNSARRDETALAHSAAPDTLPADLHFQQKCDRAQKLAQLPDATSWQFFTFRRVCPTCLVQPETTPTTQLLLGDHLCCRCCLGLDLRKKIRLLRIHLLLVVFLL